MLTSQDDAPESQSMYRQFGIRCCEYRQERVLDVSVVESVELGGRRGRYLEVVNGAGVCCVARDCRRRGRVGSRST